MDATQRQTFGEHLREHRLRAGLTQEELAERAELSPRGLVYLERDERRPQPGTARRLADALELEGADRRSFLDAARERPTPPVDSTATEARSADTNGRGDIGATPAAVTTAVPVSAQAHRSLFGRARTVAGSLPIEHRRFSAVTVLVALIAGILITRSLTGGLVGGTGLTSTPARPVVLGTWGTHITGPLPFHHMWNLTVLPNGRVAVIENVESSGLPGVGVAEFSSSGHLLWSWANTSPAKAGTSGLAGDAAGNVYVAIRLMKRVDKFSPDGRLLASWGPGLGLKGPTRVTVDRQGNIWVLDFDASRLLKLSPQGRLLASFGSSGSSIGQFSNPDGMAIGRNRDIYISDLNQDRITELSPAGTVLRAWGRSGSGPGELDSSRGLATDSHGHVYVADSGNQRVQEFSANGHLLAVWGRQGHGPGEFLYPVEVAIAPNGDLVVADDASSQYCGCGPDRIEVFSPSRKFLYQWTYQKSLHPTLSSIAGLALAPDGKVYATDADARRVVVFGPDHLPRTSWGATGPRSTNSWSPIGITTDATGHVLVADNLIGRVLRYTDTGRVTQIWQHIGGALGQLDHPAGVAVDGQGRVFVTDTVADFVDEFSPAGTFMRDWNVTFATAPATPHGAIAVHDGVVYVGNEASMTVDRYSSTGHYLGSVAGHGSASGSLQSIAGLAVDAHGRVYVVDSAQKAVVVLSPASTVVARWPAARFPQLATPRAIALGRAGNIYLGGGRQIVELAALS